METRAADGDAHQDPAGLDTQQQVLVLVRAKVGHDVQPSDTLSHLEIDSLATAELSLEIETALAVRVDDGIMDVQTVSELIAYVDERRRRSVLKSA